MNRQIKVYVTYVLIILSIIALTACTSEKTLQESFHEVLLPGYSDFKVHYHNSDASVYIFSYKIPTNLQHKKMFIILGEQLQKSDPSYNVVKDSSNELILRRTRSTSPNINSFDEYHFLLNDKNGRITVLFANIDSEVEITSYQSYLNKLHEFAD